MTSARLSTTPTSSSRPSPVFWLAAVIFLVVCLALRLAWLRCDPPEWLSWSSGVYTDEGFYTLDARHRALFGSIGPGNFHDKWLSPTLSLIQTVWFRAFGATLVSARLLPVLMSVLALPLFYLALRPAMGRSAAAAGTLFLGLAPPCLFYNYLALQETPAVCLLIGALAGVAAVWDSDITEACYGERLFVCGLGYCCLAGAYTCKTLAILGIPAIVLAGWLATHRDLNGRMGILACLAASAFLYSVFAFEPHQAQIERLSHYYLSHQVLPHTARSLWLDFRRAAVDPQRGVVPYLCAMMPVPVLLGLWAAIRRRTLACVRVWAVPALWLACGVGFCAFSHYAPSRYYVLFLPALCWIAALGWQSLSRPLRVAAALAFLATSGTWYVQAWTHRTSTVARLTAAGGPMTRFAAGSTFVGEFAPEICMGTRYKAAPMQPGLSNDVRPIETLRPDYVTVCRTPYWLGWWRSRYPAIINPTHRVATVVLGGNDEYVVDIYRTR
ncbi:MAG: hypothetical protein ACLQVD_11705 [Capsulimonadaceae bacterium]